MEEPPLQKNCFNENEIVFVPVGIHAPPTVCDYQEMIANNEKNLEGLLLNGR